MTSPARWITAMSRPRLVCPTMSIRRGSMTMSFAQRFLALLIRIARAGEVAVGLMPQSSMQRVFSKSGSGIPVP